MDDKKISVESELKDLILKRYKSLRDFAFKIDMPYSTVDTILKRGVDKANITNIIRICKELDIDSEALGSGQIIFKEKTSQQHQIDTLEEEFPEGIQVLRRATKELTPEARNTMIRLMKAFLDEEKQ